MALTYNDLKSAIESELHAFPLLISPEKALTPSTPITEALPHPPSDGEIPEPLRSAMRYSLLLPGKRLRPVLLLAAFALIQDDWHKALPFACALEMIHTYSLIHDDLPALDNDSLRRGKPANHIVFGEDIAILAGDGLLNLAYETMLGAPISMKVPSRALKAVREIAHRAGVSGMIAGQTLDVKLEGARPSAKMVAYIHRHKTADLFAAPMIAGLALAGATDEQLAAGQAYGENLGLAFQIVDDLLDLTGDTETLGKQTGMDAALGKMTWPAVHGLERARCDAAMAIERAVRALEPFGEKADFLHKLARETLVRVH